MWQHGNFRTINVASIAGYYCDGRLVSFSFFLCFLALEWEEDWKANYVWESETNLWIVSMWLVARARLWIVAPEVMAQLWVRIQHSEMGILWLRFWENDLTIGLDGFLFVSFVMRNFNFWNITFWLYTVIVHRRGITRDFNIELKVAWSSLFL